MLSYPIHSKKKFILLGSATKTHCTSVFDLFGLLNIGVLIGVLGFLCYFGFF